MMTDDERRKVFWLLKKYSSYTAWKALGDAYANFIRAWERAIKLEDQNEVTEFETEALKSFWNAQIEFEKGLPKLRRGERRIFRHVANWRSYNAIHYARRLMDPVEYVHDWMKAEKENAIAAEKEIEERWNVYTVTEHENKETPATYREKDALDEDWHRCSFPSDLPEVPPSTHQTVESGETVPIDGIWEPEWAMPGSSSGFLARLTNPAASETGRLEKGCMNYLLADTMAPPYQDSLESKAIPVRWRLIWEDTRYRDGTIPEEEAQYCAPPAPVPSAPPDGKLRAQPGEVVPKTGDWWSPAFQGANQVRHFEQGERFPAIETTNYGVVIWYYDPDRQSKR